MTDSCCCCTEILTINNVVNGKCGHQLCQTCFWKWTDEHNSCPFCRKDFFNNSKHEEYVQLGKEMNVRRELVEELHVEQENLLRRNIRISSKCSSKMEVLRTYHDEIKIIKKKKKEIVHFLVKNIDFVRQVKQWKTDPVLAHKSWRKKRHQMDHKNRTHAMKKMRIVLEEMSGGHFDENCRYVKEDANSEWIKWENQNTRKRRRLNNDDYFNINDKIMRPFVRSSNMFHFERLKISPLEANYCIKGLFQIQHSNPVISGLDYSSRRKTFHLNRVDIWLSDHFKNQLTFGKS